MLTLSFVVSIYRRKKAGLEAMFRLTLLNDTKKGRPPIDRPQISSDLN